MAKRGASASEEPLRQSREAQARGDFDAMLAHAERAARSAPGDLRARFRWLECLLYCGRPDRVRDELATLEAGARSSPALWARIAEFYTHLTDHAAARRCNAEAARLAPGDARYLYALAASEIATGDVERAERHLTDVIAIDPHDYDAYRNRSTLRRQTQDANHIAEIEGVLDAGVKSPAGEVQLCYALAREYEDIGDYDTSFGYLQRGADRRRALLGYRVEGDVAALGRLTEVFDAALFGPDRGGCDESGAIFVIGLPRSGTTLVDRILASHPSVASLGEVNDFAWSLMHTLGRAAPKAELIELSAEVDPRRLGRRYLGGIRRYGYDEPWLVDKTPLNYLYLGLIRMALPNARVVHIERHPLDSCYGMYRTLFRAGYPFSYDLGDLAAYYLAYRRLMSHWQSVLPDGFLNVRYESLVDDQEAVSRELVAYCGLDWDPACLDFHRSTTPVATESAAQVREPVHRRALGRWRHYADRLEPLARKLREAGIDVD